MSTIVGNVVLKVQAEHPELSAPVVASALAVICGCIITALGLLRLGWLVDFISLASISAFMTGAAISICVGQVPKLLGLDSDLVDSRAETYRVVINGLKALPSAGLDAAMGVSALAMLYFIRTGFNYMARKQPHRRKVWFFANTLRTVFVILLYTLISYLANMNLPSHSEDDVDKYAKFSILGTVPRGFRHAQVPKINSEIIGTFADQLPASIIVLVIEHISISKSFGRINNYTIDPSQEFVAIGVSNILGPFLGGYPATGSFSRTAIKSKAGVRTPLAGVITALVVLLAIYALPAVFFYIPSASLAAVIIHAVGDLITPPNTVYQFWRISPLEVIIFFAGVIVTVFTSIEDGIYTTIAVSAALFLYRAFKARGRFLGPVKIHSVIGDHLLEGDEFKVANKGDADTNTRSLFLPMGAEDGSNPEIRPQHPHPGVFIYRFSEGYNYPNANHYLDYMTDVIFKETQRTNPSTYGRIGDRPWNDPGPRKGKERIVDDDRPTLKAVILDFSSVNYVDITSVQHLIDVRNQLDRHAAPDKVQWHFAHINNRWTKRALVSAGFGFPTPEGAEFHRWKPIFSVAELGGAESAAAAAEARENRDLQRRKTIDIEEGSSTSAPESSNDGEYADRITATLSKSDAYRKRTDKTKIAVVHGLNRPFFHLDLTSALQSAVHNIKAERTGHGLPKEVEMADQSRRESDAAESSGSSR